METIQKIANKIAQTVRLGYSLVGVKFIFYEEEIPKGIEKLNGYRV